MPHGEARPKSQTARLWAAGLTLGTALGLALSSTWSWHRELPMRHEAALQASTPTTAHQPIFAALLPPSADEASIAGSVRAPDGRPLQGARVCAACVFPECKGGAAPVPGSCDTSSADGSYALRELLPGRYLLGASAHGHLPGATAVSAALSGKLDFLGQPLRDIHIVLERGGVDVSGIVQDASGGPIAGARVQAISTPPARPQLQSVRSEADGSFELSVEPGSPLLLRAQAPGYASAQRSVLPPLDELRIQLTPASRIRGRVISAVDAAAVSGVELRASQLLPHVLTEGGGSALSDARGEFLIEGLSAGSFHLTARSAQWLERQQLAVTLGVGDEASGITIEVRPAVTVDGVVMDARDRPCTPGTATLSALGSTGPSAFAVASEIDEAGRIHFAGVPAGEFTVTLRCAHAAPRETPLRVQQAALNGLVFRVEQALSLQGRVTDPAGRGLARRVRLVAASASAAAADGRELLSGADGHFTIRGLAAGKYWISAGERDEVSREIELHERSREPLVLVLAPGASLRVHTSGSAPDSSAHVVQVRETGSDLTLSAQRQPDGSFLIGDLAAGSYEVALSDGRNPALIVRREVPATGQLSVQLTLPNYAGSLRGQVVDEAGGPVDDAWVDASPDGVPAAGGHSAVLTAVDGTFEIAGLAPHGSFTLQANRARGGHARSYGARTGQRVVLVLEDAPTHE
jgi:hypothetical protein